MYAEDGEPVIQKIQQGKGCIYLLGFSMGYGYYETNDVGYEEIFKHLTKCADLSKQTYSDCKNGIYEQVLEVGETEKITFIFNNSGQRKAFTVDDAVIVFGGDFVKDDDGYWLDNEQMGYVICKTEE